MDRGLLSAGRGWTAARTVGAADVLDECPMIDVPRHGNDYRLLRLES